MHSADVPHYTPTVKALLLAALDTPAHALMRGHGGFIATDQPRANLAPRPGAAFTRRAVNMLVRRRLLAFDDPRFPTAAKLTERGLTAARQLQAAQGERRARA